MVCDNVHVAAGYFYGLPEEPIKSVTIENIKFTIADDATQGRPVMMEFIENMSKHGVVAHNVDTLTIKNTTIQNQVGDEVVYSGVKQYINE